MLAILLSYRIDSKPGCVGDLFCCWDSRPLDALEEAGLGFRDGNTFTIFALGICIALDESGRPIYE